MGFLDKTITKAKATAKTTSNKYNESKDARQIQSQIKAEKDKVKECYETIGKEYYRFTVDGDESHKDCFDGLVDQINESRKAIEDLEAQLEELRVNAKMERDDIKATHDAKIQEIEANDAAAKAEKERLKKENDDLF